MNRTVRTLAASASAVLVLAAAGCSSTVTVPQDDIEERISAELEEQVGQAPDDISCPDDLKGEEGEEMECTLTAGEDELGVTVRVTGVDGDQVNYEIEVDDQVQ